MGLITLLNNPSNFKFYTGKGYSGNGNKSSQKDLKYGKDTLGGGYSGQPYIQTAIPDGFNDLGSREDFILRGGINAAKDSLTDIRRLGKMFIDTKSPNGLLFIAKQQLLSRTAVRTQTSGILNEGIYSPLNTLAQAGLVAFGTHLNKQGINPFADTGAYANNNALYFNKIKQLNTTPTNEISIVGREIFSGLPSILGSEGFNNNEDSITIFQSTKTQKYSFTNRLVEFYDKKITTKTDFPNIWDYPGGPDSNLGIGNTNIRFADKRTGINNPELIPKGQNVWTYNTFDTTKQTVLSSPKIQDFRKILREKLGVTTTDGKNATNSGATSLSQDYSIGGAANFTQRVNIGDPGQRGAKSYADYSKGVSYGNISTLMGPYSPGLDKINSLPIYRSENALIDANVTNDFVKFRIAVIDNDAPNFKTFMNFRAFLGPISDSYSATWNPIQYLGRGEQFYTYNGFTRTISLSWTVAAQSKQELIPMYKKLNYLASTLAPDYSPNGYMRGNLVQLTIGGYLYEQPVFITGLTYDMGEESPWEIGIGVNNNFEDGTVKELTQIIKVTGFNFTPIQNFIPRLQVNSFEHNAINEIDATGFGETYGPERFIALANGPSDKNSNYNYPDTSTTSSITP